MNSVEKRLRPRLLRGFLKRLLPDAEGRRKLAILYARDLELPDAVAEFIGSGYPVTSNKEANLQ